MAAEQSLYYAKVLYDDQLGRTKRCDKSAYVQVVLLEEHTPRRVWAKAPVVLAKALKARLVYTILPHLVVSACRSVLPLAICRLVADIKWNYPNNFNS